MDTTDPVESYKCGVWEDRVLADFTTTMESIDIVSISSPNLTSTTKQILKSSNTFSHKNNMNKPIVNQDDIFWLLFPIKQTDSVFYMKFRENK